MIAVRVPLVAGAADADVTRLLRLVDQFAARPGDAAEPGPPAVGRWEGLRVLPQARVVYRGDREVVLTRREFDLLWHLVEHPRRVFTRAQLLDRVWGHPCVGARNVDVHVGRVRAKVGADLPVICTVRGVGYRLDPAVLVQVEGGPG
ncbi:winged helix-turn-helix domain-containing protein [Micromonospora fluostatini]|uniref:winged helix-turn-helix domain-containing protein n=1 Tax=Micromonospora sp. JCM 30529 TaxID=3421643 RepID=UPI003D17C93C